MYLSSDHFLGQVQPRSFCNQVWDNPKPSGPLQSTVELGYIDSSRVAGTGRNSELESELLCSICQNILWKPIACVTCENSFCAGCIRIWTGNLNQSEENCPFRCTFQEKRPPPILISLLSKLQIRCAYASNGCDETLLYEALEKHELTCEYEKIPCELCQAPVSLRDSNYKHDIRQCFKQMYDENPDRIQAQFIKLLDVVEASQRRIETLENLLGIATHQNQ